MNSAQMSRTKGMEHAPEPKLLTSKDLYRMSADDSGDLDWRVQSYREIQECLEHEQFPCPFAKKSHQRRTQYFAFLESTERDQLEYFRLAMMQYLRINRAASDAERLLMPLAVVVKPEEGKALAEYHAQAWSALQYLHDRDLAPWPSDVPPDPEHYLWSFCFEGVQIFINFSAPAHKLHRSRNLGSSLVFVINPRENFDQVAGNNPKGLKVREYVRARIAAYEQTEHAPENLGTYGQESDREWRQYAMPEGDAALPARCPLHIRGAASDPER